jgi:hypothetical protein
MVEVTTLMQLAEVVKVFAEHVDDAGPLAAVADRMIELTSDLNEKLH